MVDSGGYLTGAHNAPIYRQQASAYVRLGHSGSDAFSHGQHKTSVAFIVLQQRVYELVFQIEDSYRDPPVILGGCEASMIEIEVRRRPLWFVEECLKPVCGESNSILSTKDLCS